MKKLVKTYIKKREEEDRSNLLQTEFFFKKILVENLTTNFSEEDRAQLKNLKMKKDGILRRTAYLLCLKIQLIWVEAGDKNTIFFHKHDFYRKNLNTIWEISAQTGGMARSQDGIQREVISYFSQLYKDPRKNNIGEQMEVLKLFLSFSMKKRVCISVRR